MTKKQFESIWKRLVPEMPGYACKGSLLYAYPLGHVLRGFDADGSGYVRTEFRVRALLLPLYVPTDYLHFGFGHTLNDEQACEIWWHADDPKLVPALLARINTQGMEFVSEMDNPKRFAERIQELDFAAYQQSIAYKREQRLPISEEEKLFRPSPYTLEAVAYSLIMSDDFTTAKKSLGDLVRDLDMSVSWQVEMLARAKVLERMLTTNPGEAKRQLAKWEQETLKNLGLQ